jgi:hypothetical protein
MPVAGISFMCYEACKRNLVEGGEDEGEIDDTDDEVKRTA